MEEEYILKGPKLQEKVPEVSIGHQLYTALVKYQNLPCVVDSRSEKVVSYKEVLEITRCLANTLQARGYSKGTVIGILSENSIHFFNPVLAALYLGCTITTFNPAYTASELIHLTNISKPSVMFCSTAALNTLLSIRNQMKYLADIVVIDSAKNINTILSLNNFIAKYNWHNWYSDDVFPFSQDEFDPRTDVACIFYTSGTTGLPKGAMLTHMNLSANIAIYKDPLYYKAQGASIALVPFCYAYGFSVFLRDLVMGTTSIIFDKFEPLAYLKVIQKYKISKLIIAPTTGVFVANSAMVENFDLSSVECISCSGAPLSTKIEKLLKKKFVGLKHIQQLYGMTETFTLTTFQVNDSKTASCGKLVPNILAKVVDSNGASLKNGCPGELCFKGDSIMKGYVDDPENTNIILKKNGWLSSGDIGYYDKDGYFYIIGRLKELIKYKSLQVAPAELEAVLLTHSEIIDAAVIGLPHETYGELPFAFVVRRAENNLTENEVKKLIEEKLSPQKWLRGGVKFIKEIPKAPNGKILRKELREQLIPNSKL